ncbi:MAG TPA: hypothetical protein VMI94_07900 [Bryobacteraceae bacterium]|nr:hypothetical protein [Bryobacteraceae bacterium]
MKHRTAWLHHAFVFVSVVFLLAASPLEAQLRSGDCSHLVVNRSFSQQFQGFFNMGILVPTAGAGFITFLPGGKMKGSVTLAIGELGVIPDITFDSNASQYSLSWDQTKTPAVCSGTITLIAAGEPPFDFQLVVTEGGQQVEMIHTDAGLTVTVTGLPVPTRGCSNRAVGATYSYTMTGWGLATPDLSFPPEQMLSGYYPFAFSGAMELDASGGTVWWDTASLNGTIMTRSGTGSYAVKPDCTGTLVLPTASPTGQAINAELFVGKDGVLYIVDLDTDAISGIPLYVLSGTLHTTRMP